MTDEDVATKAPESDGQAAVRESLFKGDSVAQEGPSMGNHCVTDRPTPAGELPSGELSKLGGIDTYISKPADYPHNPGKLLLLLTGGTGVRSTNNQLQADKFAQEGFLVIMPDQFGGEAAPNTVQEPASADIPLIEKIKLGLVDTFKSFTIDMWLARHTPDKVLPILYKVLDAANEEFADAIANGGGIYAIGYCFGAKYVLLLAGDNPNGVLWAPQEVEGQATEGRTRNGPFIKAGAIAHGTQITPDDIGAVKVPVSIICVEDDPLFPDEVRKAGEVLLEKTAVEHEIKVYPNVPHGFAVLGDYADLKIKEAQQQAFAEMLGWLQAH
ncbi:uncharacterized protein PV09_05662 [Verruconis gallopava]|uniref:Dienelactone hydrolase domain-containing protein n=1 Tax=Verruconis gallopava TaxID=253628 RepID=A0A0D2AV67_9PEZI|nr:uncharacterized protein PV09_05662 [Verruconis gallopava]KIW03004.1 hypothetical protein PV09_05662 [Verruconis gallopava]